MAMADVHDDKFLIFTILFGGCAALTLCTVAEVVAFGLGAFSTMPAVRNFSICAALAVLLDFCLQVTI